MPQGKKKPNTKTQLKLMAHDNTTLYSRTYGQLPHRTESLLTYPLPLKPIPNKTQEQNYSS